MNDVAINTQASTEGLDGESLWSSFPPYRYDKGSGSSVCLKFDLFGVTKIDQCRLWMSAAMMCVFSNDIPWHRILEAVRIRDKTCLWQNVDAQWNELVCTQWITKWVSVHSRPMEWTGKFNNEGRPTYNRPVGPFPDRRITRGGPVETSHWLTHRSG